MIIDVPYIPLDEIEREANHLLRSFEAKYGTIQTLATPLDEIAENYLGLTCESLDLGDPEILGCLDIKNNLIQINNSLDPALYPDQEGRYNFTLGHEIGHHILHRMIAENLMQQTVLSNLNEENPNVILCRTKDKRANMEWQADKFSACLLMPKKKVVGVFSRYFKDCSYFEIGRLTNHLRQDREFLKRNPCLSFPVTNEQILLYAFKALADEFKVSMQAMVNRLKELNLLIESDYEHPSLFWQNRNLSV